MDLKVYRFFYEVAISGSIREASDKLFISPSALSRHIKTLEEQYNTELFSRSRQGMELTDTGKVVFLYVQNFINSQRILKNQINELKNVDTGSIYYGTIEGVLGSLILPAINKFQKIYPNVTFTGTVKSSDHTYKLVEENMIDFGVAFEAVDRFNIEVIGSFYTDLIFVVSNKKKISRKETQWEDLAQWPLVTLTSKFYTRKKIDIIAREHNTHLNIVIESDQISFLKKCILDNPNYLGIFPEFAVLEELELGDLIKINYNNDRLKNIKTVIFQKKGRHQSHAMSKFLSYLLNEVDNKLFMLEKKT